MARVGILASALLGPLTVMACAPDACAELPRSWGDKWSCSQRVVAEVAKWSSPASKSGTLGDAERAQLRQQLAEQRGQAKIKFEKCWDKNDLMVLGEAHFLIPWAEDICGGKRTRMYSDAFDVTGNAYEGDFFVSEASTRAANKELMWRLKKEKNGSEVSRFCQLMVESFGPIGRKWPGLFAPK